MRGISFALSAGCVWCASRPSRNMTVLCCCFCHTCCSLNGAVSWYEVPVTLCLALLLGVQLVQQITVSREADMAKVCTRAYMVTANEKSYMLTFSSLKGEFYEWLWLRRPSCGLSQALCFWPVHVCRTAGVIKYILSCPAEAFSDQFDVDLGWHLLKCCKVKVPYN